MSRSAQVAIIGCGPVGALLGNLLGRRGISCVIIEKQPQLYPFPRAVHFDAEAMRVFQSVGLSEAIRSRVLVGKGMRFQDKSGKTLIDWPRSQEIGPLGWQESFRFHQPDLETELRRGLSRFDNCEIISGQSAKAITQNDQGVVIELADGTCVTAQYCVGCDGAGSTLRAALGVGFEDLGFKENWLVVDILIKNKAADRGDYTIQFCDSEHPATYVRGVGERRRWEFRLADGEPAPVSDAETWARLAGWVSAEDAELERTTEYVFRSAIVESWRVGRCFLAGDAAHLTPPFTGQGFGAGVRDVANLGWKLAAVLKGADPGLLDTYESERSPNVREFIGLAVNLGRLINQTAAGQAPKGAMKSIWPALGAGLGPRDGLGGIHAPQFRLDDGRLSDDAGLGGFYMLAREQFDGPVPVIVGAMDWLRDKRVFGVIVRPDGYVYGGAGDRAGLLELLAECPVV